MTAYDVAFGGFGLIAVAAGLLSVLTRHVVHAALWLVVTLGAVAAAYLVMGAEFVGLVQLLVYVGAVVVLVLFALMLTRAPIGPNPEHTTSVAHRAVAAAVGVGVSAVIASVLLPVAGAAIERRSVDTAVLARDLFAGWVWPFELLSAVLLAALVGAFAVSRATR